MNGDQPHQAGRSGEENGAEYPDSAGLRLLIERIRAARHCVAFTGAGISTLSGVKDFRGKNGLYKTMDAHRIFDLEEFRRNPSFFYEHTRDFLYGDREIRPSIGHIVLAGLESKGLLKALITQNVDLLHTKAGSNRVIEIHGSPARHMCPSGHEGPRYDEVASVVRLGRLPVCELCGKVLKPAITFFGENLPAEALAHAVEEAAHADLLLVFGSSLVVYPAAGLPEETLRSRGELVIVNDQETHLDRQCAIRLFDLERTFEFMAKSFSIPSP